MREIVLDTETTGFDPDSGDRIVEIGAVELMNHLPTGRTFHVYINPERPMPQEAFEVHGLGDDFLRDKPKFAEVAADFIAFIGEEARLVIHNAGFDMKFLNAELRLCGYPVMPYSRAVDTLELARSQFPGAQNSLDALCRRFRIDNSNRTLHGALLDSELLAEVYLALRGGRQPGLVLDSGPLRGAGSGPQARGGAAPRGQRPRPLPPRITEAEAEAHAAFVAKLGEKAVWLRYAPTEGP
ncbi:DNA polymerase III subunit epsilon [Paracoccus sp. PS-1]|uniref:DNA polymerase III subunit epsilon n=1 Tax=unclassified Paracoccus (in: a-proteobacteria) TaxID=2688777 RepID=UPI00048EECB9|nr:MULTISPECIES: DNA polymerase III subunit epsilon [unclassified Paracoccus (in: a-proteobacteria)]MDQ7261755.1 DNA polymerase III subunit epsilon [Paracoccus sp. PS1]RQP06063.1 MAG: DNA polymerase III subunit epsilon [Paracoccus sp. BP8]